MVITVVRVTKLAMIALLGLELLLVYGLGSLLGGGLGEADDAKGPILLVGPLSVVAGLVVMFRFGEMPTAWLLAVGVFMGPIWSSLIFGPASETNLWPFWAEAALVLSWPVWGWLPFRRRGSPNTNVFD